MIIPCRRDKSGHDEVKRSFISQTKDVLDDQTAVLRKAGS